MDPRALRVTVGGTSKLVDRIGRAGLIARESDPDDRRASRLVLTTAGKRKLTAALRPTRRRRAASWAASCAPKSNSR